MLPSVVSFHFQSIKKFEYWVNQSRVALSLSPQAENVNLQKKEEKNENETIVRERDSVSVATLTWSCEDGVAVKWEIYKQAVKIPRHDENENSVDAMAGVDGSSARSTFGLRLHLDCAVRWVDNSDHNWLDFGLSKFQV